jgi:hypothetical protein
MRNTAIDLIGVSANARAPTNSLASHQNDYRLSPAIRSSLECLDTPIRSLIAHVKSIIDEIGFKNDMDIPTLDELQRMSPDQLRTNDKLIRLVSSIRKNIRSM